MISLKKLTILASCFMINNIETIQSIKVQKTRYSDNDYFSELTTPEVWSNNNTFSEARAVHSESKEISKDVFSSNSNLKDCFDYDFGKFHTEASKHEDNFVTTKQETEAKPFMQPPESTIASNIVSEEDKKKIDDKIKIPKNETNITETGNIANDLLTGIAFTKTSQNVSKSSEFEVNAIPVVNTAHKKDDLETNHKSIFGKLANIIVDKQKSQNESLVTNKALAEASVMHYHNEIHSHSHITKIFKVIKMNTSIIIILVVMISLAGILALIFYQKGRHISLPIEQGDEYSKILSV